MTLIDKMLASDRVFDFLRPIQFRGKIHLVNRFAPAAGEHRAQVFSLRMKLDLGEHIQRMIYLGCFERSDTRYVRRFLRPGMTMVDVGANVGYFTALAASVVGESGCAIAVEPSTRAFEHLQYLVTRNRLPQVRIFHGGLSDKKGCAPLYCGDQRNFTPTMVAHGGLDPLEFVAVRTLDDLAAELAIDRIDLLKIDVEGHEPAVLRGATELLARRAIGAVLCEFNDYWLRAAGCSSQALWRLLLDHGFRDFRNNRTVPDDGVETRLLVLDQESARSLQLR